MTVWKYVIEPPLFGAVFALDMPVGADILTVQTQHGKPCMWARVDRSAQTERRRFRIVGTGHDGADGRYIGTFQVDGGAYVFHVFEEAA